MLIDLVVSATVLDNKIYVFTKNLVLNRNATIHLNNNLMVDMYVKCGDILERQRAEARTNKMSFFLKSFNAR